MPSFSETLELILKADASKGITELRRFGDEAEKGVGRAESAIQKFSSTALKIGGAGMALGGFLTQMAAGDIQAEQQLKAAIENTGQSYEELEGKIQAAADTAVHFGITDEEVNGALTKLTLATNDTNVALNEMQLVTDLAAQRGISLGDAATLVAKVHGGSTRILKEYGITVKENADGTKDLTGAIDEWASKVQGQGEAAANTWTGKLAALRAEIENQVSAFGQQYGPTILGVSTVLSGLAGVTEVVTGIQTRMAASAAAAAAAQKLQAAAASNSAAAYTSLYTAEAGSYATTAKVAAGIGLVGVALYQYGKSLNKTSLDQSDFNKIMSMSKDESNRTLDALTKLNSGAFADMGKALEHLADQGQAGIGTLKQYRQHLVDTGQSTEEVDRILAEAAAKQENLNEKTKDGTSANKEAAYSLEQMYTAMKKLDDERTAALGLVGGVKEAEIANTEAAITAREKLDDLAKAQKDGKLSADQQTHALDEAKSSILNASDAAGELAAKTAELNGVTDTAAARQQAQIDSLIAVRNTLAPGSELYNYVQNYILLLMSVPTSITTNMRVATSGSTVAGGSGVNVGGGRIMAASGYQGWVSGPQDFTVGEGGEDEYVSITPKSKMRSGGGSGGSPGGSQVVFAPNITVHSLDPKAAGKAVHDALHNFVRSDVIAPNLKKAFA